MRILRVNEPMCPRCGRGTASTCETVRVPRHGETCVRCNGLVEALIHPDTRAPLGPRPPRGVRLIHWLTERTPA